MNASGPALAALEQLHLEALPQGFSPGMAAALREVSLRKESSVDEQKITAEEEDAEFIVEAAAYFQMVRSA